MQSYVYVPIERFFADRHVTLLNHIAKRFRIILSSKIHSFQIDSRENIEYIEDIIEPFTNTELDKEFREESIKFAQFLQTSVSDILNQTISPQLAQKSYKIAQSKLAKAFISAEQFLRLLEHRDICLVLVSAEYSFLSRPIVIEAKKRNIIVIDIEHGFFGALNYPDAYIDKHLIQSNFISDYVVVDNRLEAHIRSQYAKKSGQDNLPTFLPIGAPLDSLNSEIISKQDAIKSLKLDPQKKTLVLFSSWAEPRLLGSIFQTQFDEADFLEFSLCGLKDFINRGLLQVVIKLHPAIKSFQEDSIFKHIEKVAERHSIEKPLILLNNFEEAMAASDYIFCSSYSSVLWEGIKAGKPVALRASSLLMNYMKSEILHQTNELARSDLLKFIFNESDLHEFLNRYAKEAERLKFKECYRLFAEKWELKYSNVEENCSRIVKWIEDMIPDLKSKLSDNYSEVNFLGQKVSIIIPVFNQLDFTKQCLEALVQNTPDELYEVIIVDNASTDGTKEFLKCLEGDVKIITNEENLGFAKACNQGAKAASGKYIVFLNNDTVPQQGWLEEMIKVAESDKNIGIVGSKLLYPDGTIQHAGVVCSGRHPYHVYVGFPPDHPAVNKLREFPFVTGACMLIEKDLFNQVGEFDERYLNDYEDIDLCLKVRDLKKKVMYCPTSVLYHGEGVSESQQIGNQQKAINDRKNFEILHQRWLSRLVRDDHLYYDTDGFDLSKLKFKTNTKGHSVIDLESYALQKKVSIIIPVFNQLEYTKQCLEALVQNTPEELYEVIIVDNASTDGTKEFLKCLEGDVKIITNEENLGFAKACNQGARVASSKYLVFLNNDTVPQQGWLEEMVKIAESDESVGVVGSKLLYPDGTIQHAGIVIANRKDVFSFPYDIYHIYSGFEADYPAVNKLREFNIVTGACMLVKANVFFQVGLFDEEYINGCEDVDLCLKIKEKKFKICYCPSSVLYHYEMITEGRNTAIKENRFKLYKKWADKLIPDEEKYLLEDDFYPPSAKIDTSEDCFLNVGFVSVWFERGQAYVTKLLRDAVSKKYNTYVFARGGFIPDVNSAIAPKREGEWFVPNLTSYRTNRIPKEVFRKWILDNNIDLVIFNEEYSFELVKVARDCGAKVFCFVVWEFFDPGKTPMYQLYDKIICPTKACFNKLKNLGLKNLAYVPWGVDLNTFTKAPLSKSKSKKTIFFHPAGWGGIHNRRGTEFVINAFRKLANPNAQLVIHSQKPLEVSEEKNITIIQGTVSREHLVKMYKEADVAVLPSKWEGLGFTLLESLACGLPVITVDAPPMNEFIRDGYNGFCCKIFEKYKYPNVFVEGVHVDITDMANKMQKLMDNENLAVMSENALKSATDNYDWGKNSMELLYLIEEIGVLKKLPKEKNKLLIDINHYYESGDLNQTEDLLCKYQNLLKKGI